jgi:hypothetical protein
MNYGKFRFSRYNIGRRLGRNPSKIKNGKYGYDVISAPACLDHDKKICEPNQRGDANGVVWKTRSTN